MILNYRLIFFKLVYRFSFVFVYILILCAGVSDHRTADVDVNHKKKITEYIVRSGSILLLLSATVNYTKNNITFITPI